MDSALDPAYAIRSGLSRFPERTMFIWHLNDSLENLKRAALLFNFIGLGSCVEYDVQRHRARYFERLREVSAHLDYIEFFTAAGRSSI